MLFLSWGVGFLVKMVATTQSEAAPVVFIAAVVVGTVAFILIKSMFGQYGKGDAAQTASQV
jgi:hypothetical protein